MPRAKELHHYAESKDQETKMKFTPFRFAHKPKGIVMIEMLPDSRIQHYSFNSVVLIYWPVMQANTMFLIKYLNINISEAFAFKFPLQITLYFRCLYITTRF